MATDLKVGGRVETVAPRPVTDPGDRLRLLALVMASVVVHYVGISRTAIPTRDAITFARMALQLERPKEAGFADVVAVLTHKDTHHPPGFPLAVLATSHVVRPLTDLDLPDAMLLSAQITGAIASVLLVFPTYWLGRMLFNKWAGFLAALVFQVLPVSVAVTTEGLGEGPFFLCVAMALLFGVRTVRKPGIGGFLLCGLATGCAYLVRPEGMVVGAAVGLVIVGLAAIRRWAVGESAGRLTALIVGTLLPAIPYMLLIGGITNKPTGRNLLPSFNIWEKKFQKAHADSPALFASWYDATKHGGLETWLVRAAWEEGSKAFHHAPLFLAVIGLAVAARRFRREPELWVPVLYGGLMLVAAMGMAWRGQTIEGTVERNHYLSERHMLALAYVGCLFAAAGIQALPGLLARISLVGKWPGHPAVAVVLAIAVVGSCVPKMVKLRHEDRVGHREAGRWLKGNLTDADTLIDPFEWAQFYAERSLRTIPGDPKQATRVYAVVERKNDGTPQSELPRRQAALNVKNDGHSKLVFHWPEGPVEQADVQVYLLDESIPRKKP